MVFRDCTRSPERQFSGLEAATRTALEQLEMDTTIDHVTDFARIASYGVMSTPVLVIDRDD